MNYAAQAALAVLLRYASVQRQLRAEAIAVELRQSYDLEP
jgi:hypothetical protein